MDVRHYLDRDGHDPFQEWLDGLPGVRELRVDLGPGFRTYFATVGTELLLLLGGGSKRTQQTDIDNAIARWKDYRSRR